VEVRKSDLIKEEIADLKEVIASARELMKIYPREMGLALSQKKLYGRLEKLQAELKTEEETP
jgi:hypothetical protein